MSDPYRSAAARPCPTCGHALTANAGTFVCDRGCGEWAIGEPFRAVRAADAVGELLTFEGFKDPTAKCPDCAATLDDRIWDEAVLRMCSRHGVWLEAWARPRFHRTVADKAERLQPAAGDLDDEAVRELAERLRTEGPSGLLHLARRLVALERRVNALETK